MIANPWEHTGNMPSFDEQVGFSHDSSKIDTYSIGSTRQKTKHYLGVTSLLGSMSTSTKKMRKAKKSLRQNRKRGRR